MGSNWGWIEIAVVGGLWSIVLALVAVVWGMLNNKIENHAMNSQEKLKDHEQRIGLHDSKINDLKVDYAAMQADMSNQTARFEELQRSLDQVRKELNDGLHRISDKLDEFRERRRR